MEEINKLKEIIGKIENKDFQIHFFTADTKGNPMASIYYTYDTVKKLRDMGYNANILHEKNDYVIKGDGETSGVLDWIGEEFSDVTHISIEAQDLNVGPEDIIIIPEVFSTVMDQLKGFNCKKIVLAQNYSYILELLTINKSWDRDFGFNDVITTSENMGSYVKSLFPNIKTHIIPPSIPDFFDKEFDGVKKPIISIFCKNQGEAARIAKSFYLQYPLYKWVTFRELRGLSLKDFSNTLKESCLSVWVDDYSSFGTFPLESIKVGTPVIGKLPNMVPDWMITTNEEGQTELFSNGIWTTSVLDIPSLISEHFKLWLEGIEIPKLKECMEVTESKYTDTDKINALKTTFDSIAEERIGYFNKIMETKEKENEGKEQ